MSALNGPVPLSDDHPDELLARSITSPLETDTSSIDDIYDIESTKELLQKGNFRTVALQFPDDILHDAAEISKRLQDGMEGLKTYILADTSYGSCCVDEVAAEHVNADVVVHYGRACLSPVSRLPVIYVFGRRKLDVDSLVTKFAEACPKKDTDILLMCDTSYAYSLGAIYDRLILMDYTKITKHPIPDVARIITPQTKSDYSLLPPMTPLPDTTLLLISEPKDATTTLLTYHHLTNQIYTYSPQSDDLTLSTPTTNLALRRRYVLVQKARDAGTIGLIIGTLGKEGYLSLISLLRKMILDRGKKPYLLALGKLNPAKVANFTECDVFCIIACPESTVVDSRDYFKPIVTPYELYLALTASSDGGPLWGTDWISDFERVMSLNDEEKAIYTAEEDEDIPHFSLVTGKLVYSESSRPMRNVTKTQIEYDSSDQTALVKSENGQIAVREDGTVAVRGVRSLAGEKLIGRSWRGLDMSTTGEEAAEVEIGRDGVARGYRSPSGDDTTR